MTTTHWYRSCPPRPVPVPPTIPKDPSYKLHFVAPIRPPLVTPWSSTSCLPRVIPLPYVPAPPPPPPSYGYWTGPAAAPSNLPPLLPKDTPVWPPSHLALVQTPAINVPIMPTVWEAGTFPAQPLGSQVPIRVHPHLNYNPTNPLVPTLQWDIIHRPELARAYTGRQVIIPADLMAEAIYPSATKIYITSDHPTLGIWMRDWGPIMVEKPKIVIRDVLDAIYDYFQQPLTRDEHRRIRRAHYNLNLTLTAHQRAWESYELYPYTLKSGYRRVDVMGGHRRFQGLRAIVYQDNTWKLFLGLLPGPVPHVYSL